MKKSIYLLFVSLLFIACNQKKLKNNTISDRQAAINYLKTEFKISPNADELDSQFIANLKAQNKSLNTDSLISSRLSILRNTRFHLDFILYYPRYYYKDHNKSDHFSISFIRNYKTGKIYLDFIDWTAGYIIEDFCAYTKIDMSDDKEIPEKDIKAYSSIPSNRRFADWELSPNTKRTGIEAFLNDEFRFNRISKAELDSLFTFYDKTIYYGFNKDSIIKGSINLVQYLTRQASEIKSRYHTPEDFIYLKDAINLLIARNTSCDSLHHFQWIYKSSHRLFERMVSIKGDSSSFYSYRVEENKFCF